jgi:hypothetical protein
VCASRCGGWGGDLEGTEGALGGKSRFRDFPETRGVEGGGTSLPFLILRWGHCLWVILGSPSLA